MPPAASSEGFWGTPTATIDWCENNYEISYYVAEWWNTITNLMIILPALWGISQVLKKGFKKRFIMLYVLNSMVGVGSWMFHMTLLYHNQLLDELPMVYFSMFNFYCLKETLHPANKNFFSNKPLFILLLGLSILFTFTYLVWAQPVFHQSFIAAIAFANWAQQGRIVAQRKCKICKRLMITSVVLLLTAFFLWNIDNIYCSTLKNIRLNAPPGIGPLTHLHGWWHGICGYCAHLQILFCIHTWYDIHKEEEEKRKLVLVDGGFSLQWS